MIVGILLVVAGVRQIQLSARKKLKSLEVLFDSIQKLQFLLFSDPYKALMSNYDRCDDISFVLSLTQRMYLKGENPQSSLQILAKQLLNAKVWLRKRGQIEYLIAGRFLFVVCVVYVVRFFVGLSYLSSYTVMLNVLWEKESVLGWVFIFFLVQRYFSSWYPRHWLWDLGFTEPAKNWLAVKFNKDMIGSESIVKNLEILTKREKLVGLNLLEEKEQLIDFWSMQLDLETQFKKDKFDDALPLFEFILYSVYAILLLYNPLKKFFKLSLDMSF